MIVQQLTINWDIFSVVFAIPCDLWYRGKGSAGHWVWLGQATHVFASQFSSHTGVEDLTSPTQTRLKVKAHWLYLID